MELKAPHWIGIFLALIVIAGAFFFYGTQAFFFIVGIAVIVGLMPFVFTLIAESNIAAEKEEMFLEFTRNLVESVKTGTPISKSIVNVKNKPYGVLSPHIQKLANQISMGIPLRVALATFSADLNNKTISRAITLIQQAEIAGGDIGEILEAVAGAVTMSDKLKKERRAVISSLVVQGYLIFFIFLIIILVMQFKILPMVSGIADIGTMSSTETDVGIGTGEGISASELSSSFLYLLLIQGFFSGLTIGKLAEGNLKAGVKHSFALMLSSFLISAGATLIFGGQQPITQIFLFLVG